MSFAIATLVGFVVMYIILALCGTFGGDFLLPFISQFGDMMASWITVPILGKVIFWGQAVSVAIAVAIRVYIGVKEGLLANGGPKPPSFGEYMFKSVFSVVMVGMMPVFCQLIMWFGQTMMSDIMGVMPWKTLNGLSSMQNAWGLDKYNDTYGAMNSVDLPNVAAATVSNVVIMVALILVLLTLWALLKRQVEMLVVSVIAPWVGIKIATSNDDNQYSEFLTSLFGMCVTQWVQYLFLMIGVNALAQWIGPLSNMYKADITSSFGTAVIVLIMLSVAVGVPSLLDRWTYTGGSSGMRGFVLGSVMRSPGNIAGQAGRSAGFAARGLDHGIANRFRKG